MSSESLSPTLLHFKFFLKNKKINPNTTPKFHKTKKT